MNTVIDVDGKERISGTLLFFQADNIVDLGIIVSFLKLVTLSTFAGGAMSNGKFWTSNLFGITSKLM